MGEQSYRSLRRILRILRLLGSIAFLLCGFLFMLLLCGSLFFCGFCRLLCGILRRCSLLLCFLQSSKVRGWKVESVEVMTCSPMVTSTLLPFTALPAAFVSVTSFFSSSGSGSPFSLRKISMNSLPVMVSRSIRNAASLSISSLFSRSICNA